MRCDPLEDRYPSHTPCVHFLYLDSFLYAREALVMRAKHEIEHAKTLQKPENSLRFSSRLGVELLDIDLFCASSIYVPLGTGPVVNETLSPSA